MNSPSRVLSPSPVRARRRASVGARLGGAAIVLAGVLSAASCRQILGIEERQQGAVTDGGLGQQTSAAACTACRTGSCEDLTAACDDDTECKPTEECISRCDASDPECVAWCLGSIARPSSLAELVACSTTSCTGKCVEGSCGELRYGTSECDACVRQNCCDENAACSTNADCTKLEFCDKRCLPAGSAKCTEDCKKQYPSGGDDWAARDSCANSRCADECTRGHAWSCLDERRAYERPSQSGDITFSLTIAEFLSNDAYENLIVKACERRDFDCKSPFDTATTDATGGFELTVPAGAAGFDGFLDISGSDIFPALYYFAPPLVAGGPRGHLQLPSRTNLTLLAGALGVAPDPEHGHLAIVAWDCALAPAPGVAFSLLPDDSAATPYYFAQSTPSLAARATGKDPALGGFVNLKAKTTVTLRATVVAGSQVSAETSFYIRPGTLTTAPLPPTPSL